MDTAVQLNGIAMSNLVDGDVFLRSNDSENVTFTSPTRINYYFGGV